MKFESLEKQFMGRCRHFTGIQHEVCKKGINYRGMVGGPDLGWARHLPCFDPPHWPDAKPPACEHRDFPSLAEAQEFRKASDERNMRFVSDLAEGRCPQCHAHVKQRQVGSCVYGSCGHRLYQGKINPKFAGSKK